MVVVYENIREDSLEFHVQRRVVALRDQGYTFPEIAGKVKNLRGERPSPTLCSRTYRVLAGSRIGRRRYKYANCGRKAWKFTPQVKKFLIRKLLELRKKVVCTCVTLQRALAREMHVQVEVSGIQKILQEHGYHWLRRSQKRKYNPTDRRARWDFAESGEDPDFFMDGVVVSMPPDGYEERINYCRGGETHIWRKKSEANTPALAGKNPYTHQVPPERAIPMWGGISANGASIVVIHPGKKILTHEWVTAIESGKLKAALQAVNPGKPRGPWSVLCDGEKFLRAGASNEAYVGGVHRRAHVRLVQVPARSPDLNPAEKYWSYLRRRLRALDLRDTMERRAPLTRAAYIQRLHAVVRSAGSQRAAANIAKGFGKTLAECCKNKGYATRG